jgi:hypothetical protein
MKMVCFMAAAACACICGSAIGAPADVPDAPELSHPIQNPIPVFRMTGDDTLRTNTWVAEALLGSVVTDILIDLPPPPTRILLVPGSTEQAANLLTDVATNMLQRAGYQVHLDKAPADTDERVVELRYKVDNLTLKYPEAGHRMGIWKSWFDRRMDLSVQLTVVDRADGQVLSSRRLAQSFLDRVPHAYLEAIESTSYPFTRAELQPSGWTRRLEEIVVLSALAGLVAIYFANTE